MVANHAQTVYTYNNFNQTKNNIEWNTQESATKVIGLYSSCMITSYLTNLLDKRAKMFDKRRN